ncbi:patatin-like phospholipase domain-containing protein 4 isoform 2-T3 [Dama dama]|uniref:patatin-like phospholipase domain-containing protein 4 isoform X2 n=1 Tax=Dama dama TaxID=30532 RepID=UPI002A371F53|nr:patatin-like phospholipase domain-containing protein 4 isoform X2 [Dama dama]
MPHINLSFAACGFLGVYHLGAASALCKHGRKLLKDVKAFAGASAGSLVASVLLTAPQKIEDIFFHWCIVAFPASLVAQMVKNPPAVQETPECNKFTYDFAEEIRRQSFGALTPGYDFMARLRSGVESILPANAHELAHDRLHVSITNTRTRRNCLVSRFPSREDLIQVLLASSFLPIYAGLKPVEYKGQKWVDGGFTNSLPVLPAGRTVTISPFSGRLDVSPQDKGRLHFYVSITNQDVLLSVANLVRLNQALFPPSRRTMESLYQRGFEDASRFLRKESWFE